jgi:hypothetical protein
MRSGLTSGQFFAILMGLILAGSALWTGLFYAVKGIWSLIHGL